jgi:hypothetical protein
VIVFGEDRKYKSPVIAGPLVLEWDLLLIFVSSKTIVNWDEIPPSPMRMFFIELRHFVISSIARFFSDGTSNRVMLSLTERTRSCGVLGLFERLNRKAMLSP